MLRGLEKYIQMETVMTTGEGLELGDGVVRRDGLGKCPTVTAV